MIDQNDSFTLSVTTTDNAGAPANPTAIVCTVTPSATGVPVTPTVTTAPVGTHTAPAPTDLVGHYTVSWRATGANLGAYADSYNVVSADWPGIVSLADVRAHLNFGTSTANDEELRRYILLATDFIEARIGPVVRRTVTETVTPAGGRLFLSGPVISVTSLTSAYGYSGTYTVGDWSIDGASLIANYGVATYCWPVTVTYVGGRVIVPALIQQAALDYIAWRWESQRGPTPLPLPGGEFEVQASATVPFKIMQALEPYQTPVVA